MLVHIIDYRIANELSRRVSTLLKGLIRRKKIVQISKKSGKHSNGKIYKRTSNYIKTCSTTPT